MKVNRKKIQLLFLSCLLSVFIMLCMSGCEEQEDFFIEEAVEESEDEQEEKLLEEEQEVSDLQLEEIYVDVCGAVVNPGVYILDSESRVYQAIEAAGGFLPEAADTFLNRAQSLLDGQQIYVPTKEEIKEDEYSLEAYDLPTSQTDGGNHKINLNTADIAKLTTLPGIGEAKAKSIIQYREEHGGFTSIEDVMKVQGIKENVFMKIKDNIEVR